jgi:hypothetical protein
MESDGYRQTKPAARVAMPAIADNGAHRGPAIKSVSATPRFKHRDVVVAGNLVLRGEQSYLIRNLRGAQYSAYRRPWRRWFVIAIALLAAITAGLYLMELWPHPSRDAVLLAAAVVLFVTAAGRTIWDNFGFTAYIAAIADTPNQQGEKIEQVEMFFAPFERTAKSFCALINERIEFQRTIEKLTTEIRVGGVERFSAALDDKLQAVERGDLSSDDFQHFVRACLDELKRAK